MSGCTQMVTVLKYFKMSGSVAGQDRTLMTWGGLELRLERGRIGRHGTTMGLCLPDGGRASGEAWGETGWNAPR